MPLGNDGRVSRRPMPRQLDMSDWSVDSSSVTRDSDRIRSASRVSSDTITLREPPNRFSSFRENEYLPRESSAREESQGSYEGRAGSSSAFDMNSFSSERSTIRSDAFDTTFTSSRDFMRGGSSIPTYRSDQGSRHDNQRDVDDFSSDNRFGSARRNQHDEPLNSDRSSHDNLRRSREDFPGSGTGESFRSRASFDYGQSDNHVDSSKLGGKANSIRKAESPRAAATVKTFQNEDSEPTRNLQERKSSPLASGFGNQDEHRSPTHSDMSTPPASPNSARDSVAYRIQNRYRSPSIPSPESSDGSSRRIRPSSPCSSVSSIRTSCSRVKRSDIPNRVAQAAMGHLREELYSFRKEMREVFIRVEDMVDVHRSLFKSDPSTGSPILNDELQHEAEKLANKAFEQLADLRKRFTRLSKDFQRSEQSTDNWSVPNRSQRTSVAVVETSTHWKTEQPSPIDSSDHGTTSVKSSDMPEDDSDHLSVVSLNNNEGSTREHSPSIRTSSHVDNDDDVVPTSTKQDSVGSTAPSYSSCQLQSRRRKNSSTQSINNIDISTRTRGRSSSIISDASSLPEQCSKPSEPDTDIFKDFDKRMEEIRCSLNAIASGTSSKIAVPPKNFTVGGASSPIRAMMDATRTRSTLRDASRISSQEDDGRPQPSARETELRQLLQELTNINADNGDDV